VARPVVAPLSGLLTEGLGLGGGAEAPVSPAEGLGPAEGALGAVRAVLTMVEEVSVATPLAAALGPLMPESAESVARVTEPGSAPP